MGWASLVGTGAQGAGALTSGKANAEEARHQKSLAGGYGLAYKQYTDWQNAANDAMTARMHGLALQGYGNQNALARALGSGERSAAGASAQADAHARLNAALQSPGDNRSSAWMGAPAAGQAWGNRYAAQRLNPALDARLQMLEQARGQQAMGQYDQRALGAAGDTAVDLGRQGAEAQSRENALDAYRRQLLEQAGMQYQYQGPGPGYYKAQMAAQGLNLAGQGLMAYGSSQRQPSYSGMTYANGQLSYGEPAGPAGG